MWWEDCDVGTGSGDGGGEFPVCCAVDGWLTLPDRGMCTEECDGVGGPDEDGDNGSVTQSLEIWISKRLCQLSFCSDIITGVIEWPQFLRLCVPTLILG